MIVNELKDLPQLFKPTEFQQIMDKLDSIELRLEAMTQGKQFKPTKIETSKKVFGRLLPSLFQPGEVLNVYQVRDRLKKVHGLDKSQAAVNNALWNQHRSGNLEKPGFGAYKLKEEV